MLKPRIFSYILVYNMEIVCEQAPLLQFRAKSNLARGVSRTRPGQKGKKTALIPTLFPRSHSAFQHALIAHVRYIKILT